MIPAGLLHPQTDVALDLFFQEIDSGRYRPNASDRNLRPYERISAVWPEGPSQGKLHVFITLPDGQSPGSRVVGANGVCFTGIGLCPNPGYLMNLLPEDAQGLGVMEHLELRAHGYEVKPPEVDIVDDNGGVMEPFSRPRVRRPLSAYTPR